MLAAIRDIVEKKGDLTVRGRNEATYLHMAACNGFVKVIAYLCDQPSVDKNARDWEGNTPLHCAAFWLQYKVKKGLARWDCSTSHRLWFLVFTWLQEVMYLATHGADIHARNRLQEKPIVLTEDATMIKLLEALQKKQQGLFFFIGECMKILC